MWMMPLSSSPMSSISHLCKQQKTMVNKSVKQKRSRKNSRELKQKVLNRIHENILKRKQAEREAEGLKELFEDSAVVKKQNTSIEDQLIRRYLGPDYRKCSVHLTSCIMDYRKGRTKFPALSRNFSDLKQFDNSRTVEDAKVKNKKIKVEKCISKLDNTPTDFLNISEVGNVHGSLLSPVSVISNHEHEDVINGTPSVAVESVCRKRSRSGDKQCPGNIYNMSCETNTQLVQPHSTDALETKKGRRMKSGNCQVVGGTAGNEECKEGWLKIKLIKSSEQSEKEKTSQMRKFQPKTSQKKVNGACYQSDKIKTPAEKKIYAGKTQSVVKQEQKIEKHYDSEEEAVPPVNVIQKQKKKRVRSKGPLVTEEGEGQEGNCCDKSEDLPLANLFDKNKKKRENIVYAEKLQPCEQKVKQSHSEGSKEDGLPRVNAVNKKTKTRQKNKKRTKREQLLVEEEEKAQEGNHCDKSEECLLPLVINQKKQKSAEAHDMLNGVKVGSEGGNMNNKKLQFVVTEDGQGQFRKESGRVSSGSRDAGQEGTESPKNSAVERQGVITDSSKNTSGDTECDVKSDDNNNSGNRDSWRAKRGPNRDREVNVASSASGRHLECEETLGRSPNETSDASSNHITIHDEQNHCIDSDESVISGSEENNVASKFALVPYTSSIIQSKTDESGTDEDEQVHHATSIERKRTSDDTDIEESDNEQIFQSTGIKRKRSDSDSDEVEYHHKQIRHNTSTEYKRAISDSDGEEHDNQQTHCSSSTEHKRTVSDSDEESDNEQKQIHHSTRTKHKRTVSDSDEDESDNEQIHRSTRTEHKRTVSDSDKGESDNEQIHHSPRTEQKRTVSDSDEDERDNEQIHRSTSIKQKTTVGDKNEVKCDSEQICHTSRTKRNRIVINSICDDNNRIPIIDKSDSEEDGDDNSQCNSGSNQNKSTSDSEQDSDTGSSGDVSNELHLNDGSSDLNSTKTEKTTCTISMSGKQQLRPEKLILPPAVVPPVQNDGVQKLLSESMSSAATYSDDECSDILTLDVDTVVVEYVSRGVNRSMPNPLIPPTVTRKDVFLAANPESRRGVYDFEREFPNRNRTNWNRAFRDYDNDYDSHNKYVSGRRNYSDVGRFNDGSDFNSKNAADASSFRKEFVAIDREASDFSQNRFGSNINNQSGSHVNSRIFSNNSDIRTSIIDAAANDEFMPEDSSRLGYVNPYLRGPPNKSSNGKNKEIKSTNASVKCNFKIPKITRTTANDNVTADKKGGQQFKRPNDVTNRLGGPVVRKPEVSRNSKTDIGMESTERNKFSPKVDNLERSRVISKTGNTEQSKFRPKIDNTERSRVNSKMGNTERSQVSPKIDNTERSRVSPKMGNIERSQVSPKIDNTERSRVSPKMGNIERSQVSPVPERNGIRRSNDELLTVDKASKRCVEFPAINKTLSFKISTRPQNTELVKCGPTVVDSSSNCKGNDFSSKDMALNKTGHEFASAKQTGLGGNFQPKNKNTTVVEKVVKISPVSDRKDNYRPSGLLKGEVALNKLSSKSAIKETESSRKIKANANTNSTEKIKVSPASEESGNCISNEVSMKETALNKRGSENSSTIKLQPERNIKVGSKPGDTNPTLDENVKTDFTVPIRKGSITLNRKSLSLSSESKLEYSGDGNKKVNDVVNQQEHTVTALLADKEAQSAPKNVRKRIVIGDNPEPLKNTKGVPECFSAEKPIGHGRPERKASDSVGQESSPKLENRPRAGKSPEAGGAPTTDKAIADILKIADGLRLFIRKAAPAPVSTTNVVTDDKNPPPQLSQPGESSKGTTTMTCIGDIMTQISPFSDGDLPFEDSPADDENRDVMKSAKLNALFAGQCMAYLKTSKCKTPNCSLSHKVVRLSIRSSGSSNYNNNDDDDDDVQFSLDVLGEFVSEAPYPPLKLVEESCRILSVYRRSDTILSIVKIFMSQSAQNDVIYMESLLNVLMFALRTFYRNANSTMSVIVKYLCNAVEHNSRKQEILDNVLNIVLKVGRVKLDEMRDIYRCLVPVGDYIWPKWLVSACLFEVNRTPQSALRKKEPDFFRLCSNAILRESHEQQLYSVWKDSGQSLEKFLAYTKCPCPVSHRILRKKIMRFQQMDRTVGHYMPKEQYEQLCGSNAGDTNVSDVGNGTESQNVIEHPSIATRNVDGGAVNVNTTVQASNMSLGDAADFALHPQFKQKGADLKFKSFNQVETANSLTSSIHKHDMYSGLQNERMPFNGSRLQKTVNPSQNMLSVNNSRGTVEEENSTGLNKPSRHWLPIIHVNNQNQRMVLNSQHVLLQNDGSKSFANNVSTLFDNEKMTYEETVGNSNYNNNNQYENKPLSNNTQIQLPRPAGYRQRINQFNKNRCPATVVCDDGQHNQARGSCEQYPLESTQEHSRSYHGFGVVDQGTQNSFSSDSRHQQSKDVNTLRRSNSSTELNTLSHHRLRRTNSSTSLIDDSWNSANCDNNLPDNNDAMDYSYNQTSRSYLTKVRVPFVLTDDTTSFSNTRGENSRLSLQQHQDAGSRARITAPRTSMETGSVVCTNSRMNRRSIRPPSRSGTPVLDKPFHENRNASIRGARLNERPAGMLNANAIPFQNRNSSILNPSTGFDLRRRRPSSDLECDFETDQMALQRYLDVNDYHHVLNILEKWEDSDDSSLLTNHLFILLGEVNGNRELSACYNTYRGLMSTAINSGNISPGIRKPLVSISVTLILNFVMGEMWVEAYEIYKLLVDHKFDGSYSCEVFTRDKQTQAKRNLVFVEVCMKMGDFDEAVILLFRHDMLRNREQWVLRSTDADLLIRNQLVETLLDMMISHNNLELASRVIMELMEVHKNIARPIPLVNAYETVLTKYLNQEDTCHAIQLLKMMSTCFNGTLFIYENTLYRPLVVASIREQEVELTRKLVKKAYMIGEYTKNPNLFTVKINSVWTYGEVKVIIEDCLDKIAAQVTRTRTQPVFTDKTVEMDLSFAVTEGVAPIADTHKLLRNGDCSLVGALDRLRTILRNEFDPPLYMSNRRESDSPFIIVKKSLLIRYLTQNHTS